MSPRHPTEEEVIFFPHLLNILRLSVLCFSPEVVAASSVRGMWVSSLETGKGRWSFVLESGRARSPRGLARAHHAYASLEGPARAPTVPRQPVTAPQATEAAAQAPGGRADSQRRHRGRRLATCLRPSLHPPHLQSGPRTAKSMF